MPAVKIAMRKIKEVLRLHHEAKLSNRCIAEAVGVARSTVGDYLSRAEKAGVTWPLPEGTTDEMLDGRLFPAPPPSSSRRPLPDWEEVHRELRRKGVTRALLHEEYKAQHPDGYGYTRFCQLYRAWKSELDLVMRQEHAPGEKLFVDYAGQTMPVTDPETGEVSQAQIFVATLGASNYTYAEATRTQTLPDWTGSHVRTFEYLGGVPEIIVCDNLKSGVAKACRYEPELNPTYHDLAMHYQVAVLPARSGKPRDKAKVEAGVQMVERHVLAPLRSRTFFSIEELNEAMRPLLDKLNERPFQKLEGSRQSLFDELERPALRPLPAHPYSYREWHRKLAGPDYHVEIGGHHYSVPHRYARKRIDVCCSEHVVEMYRRGERIASHVRSEEVGGKTTVTEHMPPSHRYLAELTPERLVRWAAQIGPEAARLVRAVLATERALDQKQRTCRGILRLGRAYEPERVEAACRRALAIGGLSYRSVQSILEHGLDKKPLPGADAPEEAPIEHDNIRGAGYYIPYGGPYEC